jgi:hypothetical protein
MKHQQSLPVLLFFFSFGCLTTAFSQTKIITGTIQDAHSGEKVPFASLQFKKSGSGGLSDSAGTFRLVVNNEIRDTLVVTSVGYTSFSLAINPSLFRGDSLAVMIDLAAGAMNMGVVVKSKSNRGLFLWRKIVKHKPEHDRYRYNDFSYRLYNKLELDLNNVNPDKVSKMKLLRPFQKVILAGVDTADAVPFLPVYITESISDYYYQKSPEKRREVFVAVKTVGTKNESVARMLGGMDQNINVYNNFIPVFDKQFVSPISDNGDNYYNYKVADTQYVAGKRLIHFLFSAKHKGNNTFEGDCWVQDTSFAIQKMTLRLSKEANINYVDQLSLIQEYSLINDSTWFLSKDKIVVNISPFGGSKLSFIGKKTTTYQQVQIDQPSIGAALSKNKVAEEVVLPPEAADRSNDYWTGARFEPLNKNEQGVYAMIDTLLQMPKFKAYTKAVNFIGTGYLDVGNYQIGPWQNWIYSNAVEGLRLRFDLGTNGRFSKKVNFHGYAAYGFGDGKLKGEIDGMYLFQKHPRTYLYGSFVNDFDYGQHYFDEVSADNLFALAVRKKGVPVKYIRLKQERLDFFQEWKSGFSVLLSTQNKAYNPVLNLPDRSYFGAGKTGTFNTFEASVRLRFAYLEKFLENTFSRVSLGSALPIVELKYTKGISGVFNSSYDYHKISASLSNYSNIAPLGNITYTVFAGRTFGTLPYMFLDIAPGNEIHYYSSQSFNLLNRYEYIHDRFAGFNLEHNFGSGLFRYTAFTRKMKWRQLWTAKGLWGDLSAANKALNFSGGYPFQSLNGKPYLELGTGIDNIFKVLRFDLVWKAAPGTVSTTNTSRLGLFGSFHLSF